MIPAADAPPVTARMPAEWAQQDWLWIGFPHDADEWPGVLTRAQEQIAAFASAIAASGQEVRLLVRDAANEARAKSLVSPSVTLIRAKYGDIWLRDTGPLVREDGTALRPAFNGWGGKFLMPGDTTIGAQLAQDAGLPVRTTDYVLEGGAIEMDGTGRALTTEQCLLNPNRNPGLSRSEIEARLRDDLGVTDLVRLKDGLVNDHTDGHVDYLARFVAPGRVVLPEAAGAHDPNAVTYDDAALRIEASGLELVRIPSPGRIVMGEAVEPASYVNFAICNAIVVVPTFGVPQDEEAVAAIDALLPGRTAVGLPADAVLAGGGGFHCASQQMPSLTSL